MGILSSMLGKREHIVTHRTIDGGHPAPYANMTDEQLYNYEMAFDVRKKTFDKPPRSSNAKKDQPKVDHSRAPQNDQTFEERVSFVHEEEKLEPVLNDEAPRPMNRMPDDAAPLDLTKPVRTVTTKQPVDIITTRARHPIYKVHGYIGDDTVATVFTLDGRLSDNGPRFLENMPESTQLHLNVYLNRDVYSKDRYVVTQHGTREDADAAAMAGRLACVQVQFNL